VPVGLAGLRGSKPQDSQRLEWPRHAPLVSAEQASSFVRINSDQRRALAHALSAPSHYQKSLTDDLEMDPTIEAVIRIFKNP
jgi:hypothetical protein